ncbi:hypothetical protein ACFOHS_22835 [Jhaorihella thermophila]
MFLPVFLPVFLRPKPVAPQGDQTDRARDDPRTGPLPDCLKHAPHHL